MDFLQSCTTNVRTVENILSIQWISFDPDMRSSEAERNSQLYKTIATLRAGNILCTVDQGRLSVFGYKLEQTRTSLNTLGYREIEGASERKQHLLLDAIEGSLAYKLAGDGLIHTGRWTWHFFDGQDGLGLSYAGTVIKLHASIGTNGALYILRNIAVSDLKPAVLHSTTGGQSLCVMAPSGKVANVLSASKDDDASSLRNGQWKEGISEILKTEGVNVSPSDCWLNLEFQDEQDAVQLCWPAKLCLQLGKAHEEDSKSLTESWRQWFDVASDSTFQDPWAAAENWLTGAPQRESQLHAVEPLGDELNATSAAPDLTSSLVTSPPFSQRAVDQQAAMGGIYPTPPDGLLPGTQGAQQAATSESNPMPAINESEEILPSDEMDVLRQSISSSNAPEAGFHRSDDDLFGDMGEIDFGGNEVGDADFDYFDEPDEEPVGAVDAPGGADVDMLDADTMREINNEDDDLARDTVENLEGPPVVGAHAHFSPAKEESTDMSAALESMTASDPNQQSAVLAPEDKSHQRNERPLSPFGIRERLLPPPIPASAMKAEGGKASSLRRSSAFGPVTFNEELSLGSKYSNVSLLNMARNEGTQKTDVDISLPSKYKKHRPKAPMPDADSDDSDREMTGSEEDNLESETSVSEAESTQKLPWDSRKRKRATMPAANELDHSKELSWIQSVSNHTSDPSGLDIEKVNRLQDLLFHSALPNTKFGDISIVASSLPLTKTLSNDSIGSEENDLLPIDQLFDELESVDFVYIAQIVSEQSTSITPQLLNAVKLDGNDHHDDNISTAIQPLFEKALANILPAASACDLARLALPREPARQVPSASGKGPHPVQRPPQRSESMQQGPDCCPIPPPYIRAQRYGDVVEVLPPAAHFWSTLGLSPSYGPKDLRVISIVPSNSGLVQSIQGFINELRLVYEANKLGSWRQISGLDTADSEELTLHDESTVLVQPHGSEEWVDSSDVLQAYALACEYLGKALAQNGHEEPDRTTLVCIVNPFIGPRAQQALCACFWMLYKAYRDRIPKNHRSAPAPCSDIVLRILPCDLIASPDGLVVLDQQQLTQLSMEIYDRCPPSGKTATSKDVPPALMPYFTAPAVELAMPVPRRIPFQLASDPPGDLLHENSVLHLAYAISVDRQWMCFSWVDASGKFLSQMSICLRGRSIADALGDAWERTGEWLKAKDVTWRVYVVACDKSDTSVDRCWRSVVSKKARRQPLHITLMSIQRKPELELTPPLPQTPVGVGEKTGQGFLTPVTTPSGASMTVSPDASTAAPPTPAPVDPTLDADADAHLVDTADESWGLMLAPAFASHFTTSDSSRPLASGMLFRCGSASTAETALEAVGVDLHWDIRLRPNGTVDEGPARQAEFTLREVLRLYRNLALLGTLKGLGRVEEVEGRGQVVPLHVGCAVRGARALDGMLG